METLSYTSYTLLAHCKQKKTGKQEIVIAICLSTLSLSSNIFLLISVSKEYLERKYIQESWMLGGKGEFLHKIFGRVKGLQGKCKILKIWVQVQAREGPSSQTDCIFVSRSTKIYWAPSVCRFPTSARIMWLMKYIESLITSNSELLQENNYF